MTRPGALLSAVEAAYSDSGRFVDLELRLKRKATGEVLLKVGGRWDRIAQKYVGEASRNVDIEINESQVECVTAFKTWLVARIENKDRKIVLMAGGKRRGGKTVVWMICLFALCIALPGSVTWVVSPTLQKRDEIERVVKRFIPRRLGWWHYRGVPEYKFNLINGSSVQNLSGDVPDNLKRGGAEAFFLNEAQDVTKTIYSLGLPAISDTGGVCFLAANPPNTKRGEWVLTVKNSIQDGETDGVYIEVDPALNVDIDQAARGKVAAAIMAADPETARRDLEGVRAPIGDMAYPHFSKKINLGKVPEVGDVTTAVINRKMPRPFTILAGADFQSYPGNAGIFVRAFGDPKVPTYYAVREFMNDGWEDEFLDEVSIAGYEPEQVLWIGDASGTWQDAHHSRGRVSFDVFHKRRWRIEPPTVKKSDRGTHPKNPNVSDRLNRINMLLGTGRLIIDRELCPKLAEDLEKCQMKAGKPIGKHSHRTDALGYALWWAEPDPRPTSMIPPKGSIMPLTAESRGIRFL